MAMNDLKNKIAIVGVGYTPQGKIEGRTAGWISLRSNSQCDPRRWNRKRRY